MEYCLDTSVFTEAHRRYYGFDIAPGFWVALENNIINGKIVSSMYVKKEIEQGKDQLVTWIKSTGGSLFVEPDGFISENMRIVANFIENNYGNIAFKSAFLGNADPWVIAQAKAYELTVVTAEARNQNENESINKDSQKINGKIKIPNVCERLNVPWIDTFELLRRLNVRLGLI
ncbi:MAG: DUF4411 family protein [Chlamydiales bacterium]|nr:DUF4411 family protein [Chlamydiales bacterium]